MSLLCCQPTRRLGLTHRCVIDAQMLQWKKSKGRQYVFFQSHPGFAFGNENVTKEFYDQIMCKEVGDALHLVVERGQRWKCPTYKEGEPCQIHPGL